MSKNFEENPFDEQRWKNSNSSPEGELTALQILKLRLGLEDSLSLGIPLKSQEDARQHLSHHDWTVRLQAIKILAKENNHFLLTKAESLIHDDNVAIREALAEILSRSETENSIALLLTCTKDSDWSVRATAFQALGKLGRSVPLEPLVEGLSDEDVSVRLAALKALEKHARRVPLEIFIMTLKDKDKYVRATGKTVLQRLLEHPEQCVLSTKTIEVLLEESKNESNEEHRDALEFLGKIALYTLTKTLSPKQERKESIAETLFLPTNKLIYPQAADCLAAYTQKTWINGVVKTPHSSPDVERIRLQFACEHVQRQKLIHAFAQQPNKSSRYIAQIMWHTKQGSLEHLLNEYGVLDTPERQQMLKKFFFTLFSWQESPFNNLFGLLLSAYYADPKYTSGLRELLQASPKEAPLLMEFTRRPITPVSSTTTGDPSHLSIVTLNWKGNMNEEVQRPNKEKPPFFYAPLDLYQTTR